MEGGRKSGSRPCSKPSLAVTPGQTLKKTDVVWGVQRDLIPKLVAPNHLNKLWAGDCQHSEQIPLVMSASPLLAEHLLTVTRHG
ncbi:hypothetical protein AV530_004226 [Patagioenas fasciata monilis]|uniref:Uncharacterized protein n=1 Tax=Patagioenas fasciata monilis TaxID=372326 RepID=A0A1V4K8N1_PATFA|nr:hypothetical protein AV530_004226 [Patagioenas fasciata monilis]